MEVFGINIVMAGALSIVAIGITDWFKADFEIPKWASRIISLGVSFGITALAMLTTPMTWQIFVTMGFVVFFAANGIWHTAKNISTTR